MAKLSITEAARVTGVSRVTLHRYIKAGKLSRSADGTIDTAELLRVGLVLHPDTVLQPETLQREVTSPTTPTVTAPDAATLQRLLTVLQRELEAAHAREAAAQERETLLLQMLSQLQQQNQRLLDMPRTGPAPVRTHRPPRSGPSAYDPSPAIARIVALRQQGLSYEAIAAQLDAEGLPTRYGLPWQHSSVRYLFRTYGEASMKD
jgi:DNA-binding transcriptional MerR regulator